MTDLSEHGVRNYADCFHDYSRVGNEVRIAAIRIALEAKKRQSEFELAPLREALERELDLVEGGVEGHAGSKQEEMESTQRPYTHVAAQIKKNDKDRAWRWYAHGRSGTTVQEPSVDSCGPINADGQATRQAGAEPCPSSQANSRRNTLVHEAAANDDIGNIIRGLEQLIEERRHD